MYLSMTLRAHCIEVVRAGLTAIGMTNAMMIMRVGYVERLVAPHTCATLCVQSLANLIARKYTPVLALTSVEPETPHLTHAT